MTPLPLLLLTAHALDVDTGVAERPVPVDLADAVVNPEAPYGELDFVPAPAPASTGILGALLQGGAEKAEIGVGPEIPLPIYYSEPNKVLAIGPEGQFEHIAPDSLSSGQRTMMKSFSDKFFDGSGHIPMKQVLGMCTTLFDKHAKTEDCVGTLSKMTPTHMHGMRRILMSAPSKGAPDGVPDEGEEGLRYLHMLDRGRVLIPGSQIDTSTDLSDPAVGCQGLDREMKPACVEVMTESFKTQNVPAKNCPRMEIDDQGFTTSHYATSLDKLTPFFTLQKNWHYFDAERELRTKYETRPTQLGCGVVAKSGYERGDLIGLAGIAHATFYEGLMVALQETPWLGTNMNHCPEQDAIDFQDMTTQNHANAVIKLVEEDHKPTALWVYATEPIAAGEEITLDYNRASEKYPNFISPAGKGWKCTKTEKPKELRTEKAAR